MGISGFGLAKNYAGGEAGIEIRDTPDLGARLFRAGASGMAFVASSVLAGTDVPATIRSPR